MSRAQQARRLNRFLDERPNTEVWFRAIEETQSYLLQLTSDDFAAVTQTSGFQDVLCLLEWCRTVVPEQPLDRCWLMNLLWQYGELRLCLSDKVESRHLHYQRARAQYANVLGKGKVARLPGESLERTTDTLRYAEIEILVARYCVQRLAESVGVRWAQKEKSQSVYEVRAEFRRFGAARKRR